MTFQERGAWIEKLTKAGNLTVAEAARILDTLLLDGYDDGYRECIDQMYNALEKDYGIKAVEGQSPVITLLEEWNRTKQHLEIVLDAAVELKTLLSEIEFVGSRIRDTLKVRTYGIAPLMDQHPIPSVDKAIQGWDDLYIKIHAKELEKEQSRGRLQVHFEREGGPDPGT